MKKIIFFLLIYGTFCNHSAAFQYTCTQNIRISLLTVDPGEQFNSAFGHSAIRIKIDSLDHFILGRNFIRIDSLNYDMVYSYGLFPHNKIDFYYKYIYGKIIVQIGKKPYDRFVSEYKHTNRGVREQILSMDSVQTMFVFNYLENNAKIPNRYYRYLFFHDNCATRVRDLLLQTFDGIILPELQEASTYRDLIHRYLQKYPWKRFVIDIAFGLSLDHKTDIYEQMFLPDYLNDIFAKGLFHGKPIVKETKNVFIPSQSAIQSLRTITPIVVCCIILVLSLFFSYMKKGAKIFDFMLFFAVGIVGMLIIFLWFFSEHVIIADNNLNIIWALPTHIVMAFSLLSGHYSNFTRKYFLATAIVSVLLIASWIFLPQRLNPALIPLVLAIALRGGCIGILAKILFKLALLNHLVNGHAKE